MIVTTASGYQGFWLLWGSPAAEGRASGSVGNLAKFMRVSQLVPRCNPGEK